jgi:hypothetical protein
MIRIGKYVINPTIFPDKTSQVWHLPDEALTEDNIYWEFEYEAELIHVCQLADLLKSAKADKKITLVCPYLPYARQHKRVSNDSTFALETFCRIIEPFIDILHTFDVHDETFFEQDGKPDRCKFSFSFKNVLPTDEIDKIAQENNIDLMLFADKSAQRKYQMLTNLPSVGCNKIRDPGTGNISKFEIKEPINENLPYDWGLNPAGEALWQIRTNGWCELVFRESYLISTLKKNGFLVD